MDLSKELQKQREDFDTAVDTAIKAVDEKGLNEIYLKYRSPTGGITSKLTKKLATLSIEEKRDYGPKINELLNYEEQRKEEGLGQINSARFSDPSIDLTLPLPPKPSGYLHPTTQVVREVNRFFRYYGFSTAEGPEIETVEYNFRKLNLPEGHPATDLQDTIFIQSPNILLRTHTSSVEARILTEQKPPIRAVVAGKVYRNETANKTNSSFFHHYQGMAVDKGITIQHLKGMLTLFHKFLFGEDVVLRFRYKYYPEVSPGMGVDMQCQFCQGTGCEVCKFRGFIEVLGSGMIHYNTLKACGIDPEIYTGFAFGMGLDRLVMQKFGVSDIRKLYGGGLVYT